MNQIYGLYPQSALFHAYDNNIIFTNALQINNIIKSLQVSIYNFVDFVCFTLYLFVYPFVKSFIMLRNYSTALLGHIHSAFDFEFDFYFIGTLFLIAGVILMFKTFYDMADVVIFENARLDTRIRMSKARIEELASENNKLTLRLESKLDSLQKEVDYFNSNILNHFNSQIRLNKKFERKLYDLKKQIQKYD